MGKTYGQITAELLSRLEVKPSKPVVPQKDHIPSTEPDTNLTLKSIPDSNLLRIPGYTGFIPRRQNYFGCTYSESCRKALAEFHQRSPVQVQQQTSDLPAVVNDVNQQRPAPPLTAVSPLKSFTPTGNQHLMDNEKPLKYYISGFTGHVPGSRFQIGKGFPIITNQARIQFEKKQQRRDSDMSQSTGRKDEGTRMPTIYPTDRGMMLSYAGHIPGYRFMYGQTFGRLTQNALEKKRHQDQ